MRPAPKVGRSSGGKTRQMGRQQTRTIIGAALMLFIAYGPRAALPYLMPSWLTASGFERETFSTMLTVQSLVWGSAAVLAGILADRGHGRRIGFISALFYAAGLGLLPLAATPALAILLGGVFVGLGLAGTTFAVAFAVLSRGNPSAPAIGFGVVTAAAAAAPLAFVPICQSILLTHGVSIALSLLGLAMLVIVPASLMLADGPDVARPADGRIAKTVVALLFIGAAASGFQTGLVSAYLGVTLADFGLGVAVTVLSLLLLNLANFAGALSCGWLSHCARPGLSLAALFGVRSVAFAALLVLPASSALAFGFAALSGLVWLVALPLAILVVLKLGGARHAGLMSGLMLAAWQGGSVAAVTFGYDTYGWWGDYHRGWQVSLGLGLIMAAANFLTFRKSHQIR